MSAGLPGLGLGGLFFVVSALVAPLFELVRMRAWHQQRRAVAVRSGVSSRWRWR